MWSGELPPPGRRLITRAWTSRLNAPNLFGRVNGHHTPSALRTTHPPGELHLMGLSHDRRTSPRTRGQSVRSAPYWGRGLGCLRHTAAPSRSIPAGDIGTGRPLPDRVAQRDALLYLAVGTASGDGRRSPGDRCVRRSIHRCPDALRDRVRILPTGSRAGRSAPGAAARAARFAACPIRATVRQRPRHASRSPALGLRPRPDSLAAGPRLPHPPSSHRPRLACLVPVAPRPASRSRPGHSGSYVGRQSLWNIRRGGRAG